MYFEILYEYQVCISVFSDLGWRIRLRAQAVYARGRVH